MTKSGEPAERVERPHGGVKLESAAAGTPSRPSRRGSSSSEGSPPDARSAAAERARLRAARCSSVRARVTRRAARPEPGLQRHRGPRATSARACSRAPAPVRGGLRAAEPRARVRGACERVVGARLRAASSPCVGCPTRASVACGSPPRELAHDPRLPRARANCSLCETEASVSRKWKALEVSTRGPRVSLAVSRRL